MSADNWGICPRCKERIAAERKAKQAELEAAYGQVSRDEWERVAKELEAIKSSEGETLREDYECFTNEKGLLTIGYWCSCNECGFDHEFEHTEQLEVSE